MIGTQLEIIEKFSNDPDVTTIYELKEIKPKNLLSRAQQKYYFKVVVETIGNFHGYTPVETHELIKTMFKLETTTNLEKDEFKAMIDMIRDLWITKYQLYIQLPSDIKNETSLYSSLGF